MQNQRVEGTATLDEKTGRLVFDVKLVERGKRGRRFLKLYQDAVLAVVLRHPELQGRTLRVLLYLVGRGDYHNRAPSTARAGEDLGMQQSNVARAYKELEGARALVKLDGVYYISPDLCWKGTERQLQQFYELLAAEDQRALPQPVEA